jgi:hypothetical protein
MTALTIPRIEESQRAPSAAGRKVLYWLPLALVLLAQAALTVRLIPQHLASGDEALYISAGHQLIYEFWHGGGSPYYETFFSGAPTFYSPLAAMADYVGGLAAVRLMSLVFSLITTCLLFSTSRRLFGYWSAVVATTLFSGLFLTQAVGQNAIYDAMSLMLLAGAVYCASRTEPGAPAKWLLFVPFMLLAANFAKYITLLFDSSVIMVAVYQVRTIGIRAMIKRALVLGVATGLLLTVAVLLLGSAYLRGIEFTTLGRQTGGVALLGAVPASRIEIALYVWDTFGAVILLSFLAVLAALVAPRERGYSWLLVTCAVSSVLVMLEALHLGSEESMGRHDDFAAWFGCLGASYLVSLIQRLTPSRVLRGVGISFAAVVAAASLGFYSFAAFAVQGAVSPGSGAITTQAANLDFGETTAPPNPAIPYLQTGGRYLLASYYSETYNAHIFIHWWNLIDDDYIKYPIPGRGGNWHGTVRGPVCLKMNPHCMYLEGPHAYAAAIKAHDFAVISLVGSRGLAADSTIAYTVEHTSGYHLLTTADGAPTWIYLPDYEHHR